MDLMLTYEQQADAWASVPTDEWDAICRAQIQKIDTELFEPWEQKLVASKADHSYLRMIQEARLALKAAVEGE